LIHPARPIED
jgi:hypothetical protein